MDAIGIGAWMKELMICRSPIEAEIFIGRHCTCLQPGSYLIPYLGLPLDDRREPLGIEMQYSSGLWPLDWICLAY